MLIVMVVAVPVVVAGAGLVSFLMLRAGYGLILSGLLPLFVTLAVVATLGVFLGRAASRSRRRGDNRNRDRDGV
ncbi:MAG: hypothetical protein H0U04_20425 [Rubrobacter sp.]|nr:hypothetical protein [Rubrobacter sp.]